MNIQELCKGTTPCHTHLDSTPLLKPIGYERTQAYLNHQNLVGVREVVISDPKIEESKTIKDSELKEVTTKYIPPHRKHTAGISLPYPVNRRQLGEGYTKKHEDATGSWERAQQKERTGAKSEDWRKNDRVGGMAIEEKKKRGLCGAVEFGIEEW